MYNSDTPNREDLPSTARLIKSTIAAVLIAATILVTVVMPAEYALEELPAPNDQRVSVIPVPARTVAAIRFSGWATGGKVAKMQKRLLTTLAEHRIEVTGEPVLNQYNPPWTAPFLRRNEIAIEVRWSEELASR